MKNVLIAYDLHQPGQRYTVLRDLIERTFPSYWACLESTFIVPTDMTCAQVRDLCKTVLDDNDVLLAIEVGPGWATKGMSTDCNNWLRSRLAP